MGDETCSRYLSGAWFGRDHLHFRVREQHTQLRLDADYLTVDLLCVDTLSVRTKADPPDDDAV